MCVNTTTIAIIATSAAAVGAVSAAISAYQANRTAKYLRRSSLDNDLNDILKIAIEYPYLESHAFTSAWVVNRVNPNDKYLRYDMFCNLLFNYLVCLHDFYGGNKKKIENYVDVKTWIRLHKYNWLHPIDDNENIDGYDPKFRQFINGYIQ